MSVAHCLAVLDLVQTTAPAGGCLGTIRPFYLLHVLLNKTVDIHASAITNYKFVHSCPRAPGVARRDKLEEPSRQARIKRNDARDEVLAKYLSIDAHLDLRDREANKGFELYE